MFQQPCSVICWDEEENVKGALLSERLSAENAKENSKYAEIKAGISKHGHCISDCGHTVSVVHN